MAEWLLELFSEEIPARMQAGAARDLERMAREGLDKAGLSFEAIRSFAGPRRLTLVVEGLPAAQPDRIEERKGPRTTAPEAALAGFLRSTGLTRDQLIERDGVFIATIPTVGRPTPTIIAELVSDIIRRFPWPKSMTWGSGSLRWVRPLHRIFCVFDGAVVPFAVDGIESGDASEGHRVMAEGRVFTARNFADYSAALAEAFVVLDVAERSDRILQQATALAEGRGQTLVDDAGLLTEVSGMVEWPVALLGDMDERFLDLPPEVIRTTMRTHQRYFAVCASNGKLAPHFITVANLETADSGGLIARGNARVLAARLEDARFFWDEDRKVTLESRLPALEGVVFHAKLGSMRERADRLERLARDIAPLVLADRDLAAVAGRFAKADLVSGMVAEFPELQGIMGGRYAREEGQPSEIANAIRDHYNPQGPGGMVPSEPVTMAVALADKMDTITGFFSIGEKPTGSRDPFAVRRAALGVLSILSKNDLKFGFRTLVAMSCSLFGRPSDGIDAFFFDRLKVLLREDTEPDYVDAIMAFGDDRPARLAERLRALEEFLVEGGEDLLVGSRRAANIINAEAKKGPLPSAPPVRPAHGSLAEADLFDALEKVREDLGATLADDDYVSAMNVLAGLREPVDRFFEQVLVNSDDRAERDNRLALLMRVRGEMRRVADFSLIKG